jgi:hypothetical protein
MGDRIRDVIGGSGEQNGPRMAAWEVRGIFKKARHVVHSAILNQQSSISNPNRHSAVDNPQSAVANRQSAMTYDF